MHHNTAYGFDPHDDSDFLNIHDNEVYNNGNHGIIASKRCNDVSIQNNEVYDGDNAGLFLHRSSDNAIVKSELRRNASMLTNVARLSACCLLGYTVFQVSKIV